MGKKASRQQFCHSQEVMGPMGIMLWDVASLRTPICETPRSFRNFSSFDPWHLGSDTYAPPTLALPLPLPLRPPFPGSICPKIGNPFPTAWDIPLGTVWTDRVLGPALDPRGTQQWMPRESGIRGTLLCFPSSSQKRGVLWPSSRHCGEICSSG